ncbi:hypothetical protein O6P43_014773 [Quillaja saponaria]|uniref:Uncharacterized protein n=1 Tax=Quillaja saponaria TaxID=32244 RepID=A0AAD7LVK7_QUISA|nr:hypothetical protein O6P43_014773 [Quillaja saponaria]
MAEEKLRASAFKFVMFLFMLMLSAKELDGSFLLLDGSMPTLGSCQQSPCFLNLFTWWRSKHLRTEMALGWLTSLSLSPLDSYIADMHLGGRLPDGVCLINDPWCLIKSPLIADCKTKGLKAGDDHASWVRGKAINV